MTDTLSAVYYEENSDSGLVSYWRFDEDSGDTTFDLAANQNHGIVYGPVFVTSDAGHALQVSTVYNVLSFLQYVF